MTRLQSYTQQQLASSVVGVPNVDRSGQILAAGLQKVAGDFANFQIQNLQRRTAAEDTLAINAIKKSRDIAKLEMEQFIIDNPNPATWENGWDTVIQKQQKEFIGKTLTRDAAANERVNQKAFELGGKQIIQTAATEKTIDNAIKVTDDNLFDIRSNPFSTEEQIIKATAESKKELLTRHTEDIANIILEENLSEAGEEEIENINKIGRNLITSPGSDPDIFKKATNDEIRSMLPNGHKIPNSDIEALRDFAGSVGDKAKTDSEIAMEAALLENYTQIQEAATLGKKFDIDTLLSLNDINPDVSDEDKIQLADDTLSYFKSISSLVAAKDSDDDVYDELTQASEEVERGSMSPAAFEKLYAKKKEKLDKDDQRLIRNKDIVATRTMQNRAFSSALSDSKPSLVELTESDLGGLKLARQNAEIIKDIPAVNSFNISIKKNQAERWNFGRFRKQLRAQLEQNPDWSSKQIRTQQEILVEQLDLPVGELLKVFDADNPNDAILAEPPDISFEDIWDSLELDDKARVWELRMRGAPTSVILSEIK